MTIKLTPGQSYDTSELISLFSEEPVSAYRDFVRARMARLPFLLGSSTPIERLFGCAMFVHMDRWRGTFERVAFPGYQPIQPFLASFPATTDALLGFFQVPFESYVLDFLFCVHYRGARRVFAVECDGHDFHERTKEQAQKDRKRDRVVQSEDMEILRYTGSEIWNDPIGAAQDCMTRILDSVGAGSPF